MVHFILGHKGTRFFIPLLHKEIGAVHTTLGVEAESTHDSSILSWKFCSPIVLQRVGLRGEGQYPVLSLLWDSKR